VKKLASTHVFIEYIEIFQANVSKNFGSQTAFIKASFQIQVALNNQNKTQFENNSNHFFQIISPIPSFSKSIHIQAKAHHSTLKSSYIQALYAFSVAVKINADAGIHIHQLFISTAIVTHHDNTTHQTSISHFLLVNSFISLSINQFL
jgi:hypothetical protein